MTSEFLPYGRHSVDDDDVAAVVEALRSDALTVGAVTPRLEAKFADTVGAGAAVAVSSGTAALHVAAMALRLGPGDAVVVPSLTFLATASAPHLCGAEVVFADVDGDDGLLTPDAFSTAVARSPGPVKAVFPVHLNGQSRWAPEIKKFADERGIRVVEDACHSLGGSSSSSEAGRSSIGACAHSDIACFSMHPVKLIAMGEGGMATTNDPELAARMRLARNHGMTRDPARFEQAGEAFDVDGAPNPWYYEMSEPGLNYRASEIHAALGLSQLGKMEIFLARRRALAAQYDALLAPLAPLVTPVPRAPGGESGWHLYAVRIDFDGLGRSRADVMRTLADDGVGSQVHYRPVHRQPFWRRRNPDLSLPGADRYYARCLSIPLFPALSEAGPERVAASLTRICAARRAA